MKFSMDGFRKQLHVDLDDLKQILERVMLGKNFDTDELAESFNIIVQHSNIKSFISKGITMTDKILVSRKEIEKLLDGGIGWYEDDLRALLDKAEVVRSEAVAYYWVDKDGNKLYSAPYFGLPSNETVEGANLRQHYRVPLYTTPQPSRIAELEAEIARLNAIT